MAIHLEAQLTVEDYAQAQLLNLGVRSYIAIGIYVLAAIIFIALSISGGFVDIFLFSFQVFVVGILLFLILRSTPFGVRKRTAKLFRQHTALQLPREIDITETQLLIRSQERGEWRVPWDDFHKWKGNRNLVLVYPSDRIFHMFPRRWFASDEEFQRFKDLLARTIGPEGKARKRA